ncbi:GntR family transcriptional regulator [Emergencia sp.]|uniref:GntR family transcriptional regulator n=1 Tax=Emergencia sp. TaxID=1926557 RepID=UPI003AF01534
MEEKLSHKIYAEIRNGIIDGEYSARDFLSEGQIAKKYGVSKAPVKEALHILADQGYLISYPRRGYMINTYSDEELDKIQEIRKTLEGLCVRLAITNASDEELETLRFYRYGETRALDPRETVNFKFHIGLARLSGNEFLVDTLIPLVIKASMNKIKCDPDIDNFDKIIDAMQARDEEKALQYLDEDIRYLKRKQ